MDERLTVPLTREQAEWLRREAEAERRPKAFVVRELIDAARADSAACRIEGVVA